MVDLIGWKLLFQPIGIEYQVMNPNGADVNSASLPIDKRDASSEQHDAPDTMDDNVQHTIISTENDRKNRKEMDSASIVFASCITRDMTDIIQAFATQSLVQFQMFKQIWKQKRMSAAFHVEFWDSNPTQIHETILCSALGTLLEKLQWMISHCFRRSIG